jgi:hypothetical protein
MAEFGLGKLFGSILFKFTLSLLFLFSLIDPADDEAFKLVAESIAIRHKVQIFLFVGSSIGIVFYILNKLTQRDLAKIQLELEKEKLRSERLLNELRELEIKEKSTPK